MKVPANNRIVVILGTNASGKSELAVSLARKFHGEIVSADSRQVYRGLDIGTGKLPIEDRAGVSHHLLDVVDVGENFSLAHYQRLAYVAIDKITAQGRLPFLVGGTGLYIEAVVDGYDLVDAPPKPELRAELSSKPTEELAKILKAANPDAASRIELHNKRRIIRALEIHHSGFAYSLTRQRNARYQSLQMGVTWPWPILCERIDRRLQIRLEGGMIEEVRGLLEVGISPEVIDDLGLEYRHVLRFVAGAYPTKAELYDRLRTAIRRFARRQISWFKRDHRIIWLDTLGDYHAEAEHWLSAWWGRETLIEHPKPANDDHLKTGQRKSPGH